jgi:hypothetical protein
MWDVVGRPRLGGGGVGPPWPCDSSGTLDTGIAMIDSGSVYGSEGYATSCAFSFTVNDVPAGHSSHRIEVDDVPNGLSFSEQELRDGPGLHNGS